MCQCRASHGAVLAPAGMLPELSESLDVAREFLQGLRLVAAAFVALGLALVILSKPRRAA